MMRHYRALNRSKKSLRSRVTWECLTLRNAHAGKSIQQLFDLLLHFSQLFSKGGDLILESLDSLIVDRAFACRNPRRSRWLPSFDIAAEQMHVTCFFGSGLPGQHFYQGRLTLHQALEG